MLLRARRSSCSSTPVREGWKKENKKKRAVPLSEADQGDAKRARKGLVTYASADAQRPCRFQRRWCLRMGKNVRSEFKCHHSSSNSRLGGPPRVAPQLRVERLDLRLRRLQLVPQLRTAVVHLCSHGVELLHWHGQRANEKRERSHADVPPSVVAGGRTCLEGLRQLVLPPREGVFRRGELRLQLQGLGNGRKSEPAAA